MLRSRLSALLLLFPLAACTTPASVPAGAPEAPGTWRFAVSGDSRNCGDVIMPAIAAGVHARNARFYWHLGDFRALYFADEDIAQSLENRGRQLSLDEYRAIAWPDFLAHQLAPFEPTPVYLTIGNHELIQRTRADYLKTFSKWTGEKTYSHWTRDGIDFISVDNGSAEQFDTEQMDWFRKLLAQDVADPKITTIVVGMHAALPDSISFGHSMSASKDPNAVRSGREVYDLLLKARDVSRKQVYVLASHSHYFMDGIFNTDYWKNHGGVLPGWITGSAGAQRIPLPDGWRQARQALEHAYGYLLATVDPESKGAKIRFDFQMVSRADLPAEVLKRYPPELIDFCFDQNSKDKGY